MYVDMLNVPNLQAYDFSHLNKVLSGAASCPAELARQLTTKLDVNYVLVIQGRCVFVCITNLTATVGSTERIRDDRNQSCDVASSPDRSHGSALFHSW